MPHECARRKLKRSFAEAYPEKVRAYHATEAYKKATC